ncbi:TIGR04197 family type VII secretion effector [uncultured Vagococcus sp.]|uniref:TIGR04197 family type VII secretion effector n=1 Tax=uncultured Vagococcus sp. TaxID=189676 RepID=UPI0028D31164|nr:TIGR04197 family type VII secretion effector [uncultured Vagococcus sp.]
MEKKVELNYDVFINQINQVESANTSITFSMTSELSTTDINPFKSISTLVETLETNIKTYQSTVATDVSKVKQMGDKIKATDESLKADIDNK